MNTWATFAVRFSWGIDTVLDCDYKFTKKLKTEQHFYKGLNSHLFHFIVETTGSIDAKDAFLEAIQIIKEHLISYKKLL